MKQLLRQVKLKVESELYLKDPDTSELGRSIISKSIEMIEQIGLEKFTFKKLSNQLDTTESSIYRYFENKHVLLLYLINWYWTWLEYKLVFGIVNVNSPDDKLSIGIKVLTQNVEQDSDFSYVNEVLLNKIVISESTKAYFTKQVDDENKKGLFKSYKNLCGRLAEIFIDVNPSYKYPNSLASTIIEGAHYQTYFAEHLPSLTDVKVSDDIPTFFLELARKALK